MQLKFPRILIFIGGILVFEPVLAGAKGTGTIKKIGGMGWGENSVYFGLYPKPTMKAEYSDHEEYDFVIDISTERGKAFYSMLLTARSTGSLITVKGTGVCPVGIRAEEILYWALEP